jgi:hypothetical protein
MHRSRTGIIALTLAVMAAACATTPLGKAGLQGEHTLAAVRDLTASYEQRNVDAFMDKVSTAYPEREELRRSVERIFSLYQTIRFKVHYTKMVVLVQDKGNIKATFTWEGEWSTSGGKIVKDGARVTLVLDPGVYKLLGIEGKNPYVPSDNPAPAKQ